MNKEISMTAPVTMSMKADGQSLINMDTDVTATMGFFVPKAMGNDVPTPNDDTVKIESIGQQTVASIRFGGWASMTDNLKYRDELISLLGDKADLYDTVNFVTAGYDAPFKFFNRRNEVWLVMKPKQ